MQIAIRCFAPALLVGMLFRFQAGTGSLPADD